MLSLSWSGGGAKGKGGGRGCTRLPQCSAVGAPYSKCPLGASWKAAGEQQRREDEEREARKMLDQAIQKQEEEAAISGKRVSC